jgi:integrase
MTKNGYDRDVPLSKRALELWELVKDGGFELEPDSLSALFRKASGKAGVVDLHFHDSRHEAITRLAKKLHVLDLARMVGHRDIRMLQIYYNATAEQIADKL